MAKAKKKRTNYRALYLEAKSGLEAKDREIEGLRSELRQHAEWVARLRDAMNDNQREAASFTFNDPWDAKLKKRLVLTKEGREAEYAFEAALMLFERCAASTGGFKL